MNIIYLLHYTSRAAMAAKSSAERPAALALSDRSSGNHQVGGMRFRWGHLRTASSGAPMSSASAVQDGQSSQTSRNEVGMYLLIGRMVLKCKTYLSHDEVADLAKEIPMDAKFRDEFTTRVFSARESAGLTQEAMAHILRTSQTTYSKWEGRSLMPHRYVRAFCLACHVTVEWLMTGLGPGPKLLEKPPTRPGRPSRGRRSPAGRAIRAS